MFGLVRQWERSNHFCFFPFHLLYATLKFIDQCFPSGLSILSRLSRFLSLSRKFQSLFWVINFMFLISYPSSGQFWFDDDFVEIFIVQKRIQFQLDYSELTHFVLRSAASALNTSFQLCKVQCFAKHKEILSASFFVFPSFAQSCRQIFTFLSIFVKY